MPFYEGGAGDEGDIVEVEDLCAGRKESDVSAMSGRKAEVMRGRTLRVSSNLGWRPGQSVRAGSRRGDVLFGSWRLSRILVSPGAPGSLVVCLTECLHHSTRPYGAVTNDSMRRITIKRFVQ